MSIFTKWLFLMMNIQIFGNKTSKSTIFFIHGNSLNLDIFRFQYESDLAREYRLVGIDLPGHGQSSKLDRYSISTMTEKVCIAINSLASESCYIVAHSLGGHLILQGLSLIKNLNGLLLVGTPPLRSVADMEEAFIPSLTQLLFKSSWNKTEMDRLVNVLSEKHCDIIKNGLSLHDPKFKADLAEFSFLESFKNEWQQIANAKIPVYLSCAANDQFINCNFIQEHKNQIALPNVYFTRFEEGGHLPFLNNPNRFNSFLGEFLRLSKEQIVSVVPELGH